MSDTHGRWGLCPWFEEHGPNLIHPDDLGVVRKLSPYGKLLRHVGEEDGFIKLRYGETEVRVRPTLFEVLNVSARGIGEAVTLEDGRSGEVVGVQWHHKRGEPMYQLRIEGKQRTKRYWVSDFASG